LKKKKDVEWLLAEKGEKDEPEKEKELEQRDAEERLERQYLQ
jgi:hypothetical protein